MEQKNGGLAFSGGCTVAKRDSFVSEHTPHCQGDCSTNLRVGTTGRWYQFGTGRHTCTFGQSYPVLFRIGALPVVLEAQIVTQPILCAAPLPNQH
jgi:hypothetical protein